VFGQLGSSSEDQHTHRLSKGLARLELHRGSTHSQTVKVQRHLWSARLKFHRGSTQSPPVKGSATWPVSEARARQMINTHLLSRDQGFRSARLELHRGSAHSQTVEKSATCSVSETRAPQRINTLTTYQGISEVFGQQGSNSTKDQHTHELSRDQQRSSSTKDQHTYMLLRNKRRVRSATLELCKGSAHSPTVKGPATSINEDRAL
jgi:hypothetical protein